MKSAGKKRLDQLLVDRGLADSRQKAQALILAGSVLVANQKIDKPGHGVAADAAIEIIGALPFVSRGGYKLDAALTHFAIDVTGKIAIDIGSSTGGFTDCLLQRGAARVYAVDVGDTQLDWKVRTDPRVVVRDRTNARHLQPGDLPELCDIAVCDVSFISVTLIAPALPPLLHPLGEFIVLVKPQFEVGRAEVGKGGIVRDAALHAAACEKVSNTFESLGYITEVMDSPITGAEGNREFLLHAHR
ncbi:MAG TPA: TlyA family RNA methyltransferase [Bryobacteraceae bacterium]|nr:TlyA family RNA methyltransferase [Bryobacteraceae bacterium]